MIKKIVLCCMLAASLSVALAYSKGSDSANSELTKENIDALSWDIVEWWNSKDYDCVPVTCNCILYKYPSNVAGSVEKGKGDVAHSWNCTGCGDCGW